MNRRFLFLSLSLLLMGLIFMGCKQEPKTFLFTYSMESVDNYKIVVSFDSEKKYKVEEYNYFLDNQANKKDPKIKEGELTAEEYADIKDKIFKADLFKMDETYGFDGDDSRSDLGDIMYQVYLSVDGEEKYISIANNKDLKFPAPFVNLVNVVSGFLNTHKAK